MDAAVSMQSVDASRHGGVGLSQVHSSSEGRPHGEFKSNASGHVPLNGWGPAESAGWCGAIDQGNPGDRLGTVRRDHLSVSVGVVPVVARGGQRGRVARFSGKSRSRLGRYLAGCRAEYRFMGTLTVGSDWSRDGAEFKSALDRFFVWFMRAQRRHCKPGDADVQSICWWLEFQARGAPHVHFLYTCRVPWKESAIKWAECIDPEGRDSSLWRTSTKFESIRGNRGQVANYAKKYARKWEQKTVPQDYENVGNFWGVRGLRETVTCHVTKTGIEGGFAMVSKIRDICERGVDAGLLRRWRWEHGDGAIYYAVSGGDLYACGIGQQIDLILCREVLSSLSYAGR